MIINPYQFGVSYDPDALAFITAANITDNTQKLAINQLVIDLKFYGIWTKMYAIYPFVGGSATTHKFNLKNPADTDAAFRLVFNGGWTHSATGILGNGVNSYADTKLGMNVLPQDNAHISIYCRTNTTANIIDMGVQYTTISFSSFISCKLSGNFNSRLNTSGFTDGLTANADSSGQYISWRSNNLKITTKKNLNIGNAFNQTSTSAGGFTFPYFIGNLNFNNAPLSGYYSNREYAFATLGEYLGAGNETNLCNIITTFQTTIGR